MIKTCFLLLNLIFQTSNAFNRVRLPRITSYLAMASLSEKLTNDGGVIKELLLSGKGQSVETGDILAVEYSAYLAGSNQPFARGEKEKFILKDGSMIKGWDIGVSSMKIGERAVIKCTSDYAYGNKGIDPIIPQNAAIDLDIKLVAWLGNQLRPETLFQKDLDIDPFVASTPEAIQAEFEKKQNKKGLNAEESLVDKYIKRFSTISFGFGGSNFFASQSGQAAPWILNPNITFPGMIAIVLAAFITVLSTGSVKEKGALKNDLEISSTFKVYNNDNHHDIFI